MTMRDYELEGLRATVAELQAEVARRKANRARQVLPGGQDHGGRAVVLRHSDGAVTSRVLPNEARRRAGFSWRVR